MAIHDLFYRCFFKLKFHRHRSLFSKDFKLLLAIKDREI